MTWAENMIKTISKKDAAKLLPPSWRPHGAISFLATSIRKARDLSSLEGQTSSSSGAAPGCQNQRRAKWSIAPELIPVSVAQYDLEYFYSPITRLNPDPGLKFSGTHLCIYTPGWREALFFPRTQPNNPGQDYNRERLTRSPTRKPSGHRAYLAVLC